MKKIKLTENDLTSIVAKIISEQNMAINNGSGFSQRQGSSNTLNKFNRRQEFREDAGMDTPGGNPDYFYGDGSLDKLRKMTQQQGQVEMSNEEIVQVLWQIQGLLSEGAPAIALRRVTELLGKMGEDVEFEEQNTDPFGPGSNKAHEGDIEKKIDIMGDKIDDIHKILSTPSKPWNK